ncbi:MAG: TlpA family protein disulfide reductase [Deltaproteobacteria bacterium]|nr:TlpA family protein disulfide reductase [Deltaproteobacteria bacterium]
MRWISLIFLLIVGTAVPVIQPLQAKDPAISLQKTSACESFGVQKFQNRKDAPVFSLKDLNGNQVSLKGYYGKPLLLFFWASWCPACKEDLALLDNYLRKNSGLIEILTLAIDGEKEKRVKSIVKDQKITLPVLLDRKEVMARAYGVRMVPTALLISREGVMEGVIIGQRDWCAPEAHLAIQELLNLR